MFYQLSHKTQPQQLSPHFCKTPSGSQCERRKTGRDGAVVGVAEFFGKTYNRRKWVILVYFEQNVLPFVLPR